MERMIQVEKENVEQSVFVEREPMTLNIGGTTDYNGLSNKPSINGTTLSGDKSLSDLGINIPDVSNFITKDVNDLTHYTLATNTGSTIELTINNSTYVMTLNLKNASGTTISTQSIDLPLETMVVNGSYDSTNKKVILTLQNGNTVDFSVADLVSGLQSEITSSNKLSSDLVDDTNHTNKFVTSAEKDKINIITSNGAGNNYLANDGTYKEIDLSSYAPKTMIGDLEDLDTTDKSDIVSAINEIFSNGGKTFQVITEAATKVWEYPTGLYYNEQTMYMEGGYLAPATPRIVFAHRDDSYSNVLIYALKDRTLNSYRMYNSSGTKTGSNAWYYLYNVVTTDSSQTIAAKKTFNTLPESGITPTLNNQFTNKKYVDDSISSAVGDIETILTTLTTGNGV